MLYVLLCLIITSCDVIENNTNTLKEYDGIVLNIAFAGEVPEITNENVIYESIDLSTVKSTDLSKYDAIFIMEDMLEEASQAQYSELYEKTYKPFFFIGTQKSYIPFIYPELRYEDAEILEGDNSYITGIAYEKNGNGCKWKVESDKKDETYFKDIYNETFRLIEKYVTQKN